MSQTLENYPVRRTIPMTSEMDADLTAAKDRLNEGPGIKRTKTAIIRGFIADGIKKALRK